MGVCGHICSRSAQKRGVPARLLNWPQVPMEQRQICAKCFKWLRRHFWLDTTQPHLKCRGVASRACKKKLDAIRLPPGCEFLQDCPPADLVADSERWAQDGGGAASHTASPPRVTTSQRGRKRTRSKLVKKRKRRARASAPSDTDTADDMAALFAAAPLLLALQRGTTGPAQDPLAVLHDDAGCGSSDSDTGGHTLVGASQGRGGAVGAPHRAHKRPRVRRTAPPALPPPPPPASTAETAASMAMPPPARRLRSVPRTGAQAPGSAPSSAPCQSTAASAAAPSTPPRAVRAAAPSTHGTPERRPPSPRRSSATAEVLMAWAAQRARTEGRPPLQMTGHAPAVGKPVPTMLVGSSRPAPGSPRFALGRGLQRVPPHSTAVAAGSTGSAAATVASTAMTMAGSAGRSVAAGTSQSPGRASVAANGSPARGRSVVRAHPPTLPASEAAAGAGSAPPAARAGTGTGAKAGSGGNLPFSGDASRPTKALEQQVVATAQRLANRLNQAAVNAIVSHQRRSQLARVLSLQHEQQRLPHSQSQPQLPTSQQLQQQQQQQQQQRRRQGKSPQPQQERGQKVALQGSKAGTSPATSASKRPANVGSTVVQPSAPNHSPPADSPHLAPTSAIPAHSAGLPASGTLAACG